MENKTHYAPLPIEFKKNGYNYKQVERTADMAIYGQYYSTKLIAFEVFRIQLQEAGERTIDGQTVKYEAKERLPSMEEWGKYGWTCNTILQAQRKMADVSQKVKEARHAANV